MPVREFTDSQGVEWRIWDVTPAYMHPATRAEDFMGNLQDGWLVFESETEKRRLEAPYPAGWVNFPIRQLEELWARATPVVRRSTESTTGKQRAVQAAAIEQEVIRSADAERKFTSPGGREWTVRVHECLDADGKEQTVLRFTTEDIVVELSRWPQNWQTATLQQFALMLLDANPPRRRKKGEGPQRRREDREVQGDVSSEPPRPSP
ncbi:MAG TPA: hypothetical protein VGG84_06480 [Gemmatimonadaceae bacterium]